MKKKNALFVIVTMPLIVLITMWGVNNYINEKVFNEDKAALFDECMIASYNFISKVQHDILVVIDAIEESADLAYSEQKINYKEIFQKIYYSKMDNDENLGKAIIFLINHEIFISSAVNDYLMDGGDLRRDKSYLFQRLIYVWMNIRSPEKMEYNDLKKEMEKCKSDIKTSQDVFRVYSRLANENFYAFKEISPSSKLYIWQRHTIRKNWPFNLFKRQNISTFEEFADKH